MSSERRPVSDELQRRIALDPQRSFIVQAPAGSGKTELLTQRYLALLAHVNSPEEVIAITFTRKAAGEMRDRILQALHKAQTQPEPDKAHERTTWELGRRVLERDAACEWNIVSHPARLRIQTIDSLCASLTRQLPLLSRFGTQPEVTEDAQELYRRAVRDVLGLLDADQPWAAAARSLLAHLDNNLALLEDLLAAMLGRRDQWLPHVLMPGGIDAERRRLEDALAHVTLDALSEVREYLPAGIEQELVELACFAAERLAADGAESPILACRDLPRLPAAGLDDLAAWRGIANLLLTNEGNWRRSANKGIGFPAASSARDSAEKALFQSRKERFLALLESLAAADALRLRLHALRTLPPTRYSERQWEVIQALVTLLPVAAAQLELVFRERGMVDFIEVAQAALVALGEPDNPTDLALSLDYRIRHLLVDEFQDTSVTQFKLLERLTAGWEPGDGRTLFAVGDPMQSIYRFRQAEVGLFLRARQEGIGAVKLHPLTLSVNFRSEQGIVDWVNMAFRKVFPPSEDMAVGAVSYSPSEAFHGPGDGAAVAVHPFFADDARAEARHAVQLVQEARRERPDGTTAILVRSRSHLAEIVPLLQESGLRYRAVEIEQLGHRPVVQDLLALTRALLHPGDRIAWLALLRAPWCGLTLADLHALAGDDHDTAPWDLLQDDARLARLSADGRSRAERLRAVLRASLGLRRRRSLRRWVEGTWVALGGPACVSDETDLEDALVYLDLVERLEEGAEIVDLEALAERTNAIFALPDMEADESLQIMTVHKAKGLEFDTVILPGLGRPPQSERPRLLMWMERPRSRHEVDLLLAPIKETGGEEDAIYKYLSLKDREKEQYEAGRLLYVAATRARRRLHLLGHVRVSENDGKPVLREPASGSLLRQLWDVVKLEFEIKASTAYQNGQLSPVPELPAAQRPYIRRLAVDWRMPEPPAPLQWKGVRTEELEAQEQQEEIQFLWASSTARHVGTLVHRMLRVIGQQGLEQWSAARVAAQRGMYATALRRLGVPAAELDEAVARLETALQQVLADPRAGWILSSRHRQAHCEYPLSGVLEGKLVNVIIDRTFVTDDGTRWIIDYKVGVHEGSDVEAFLDTERERYRKQLERYAALMAKLDDRPIRLGLYFPLLCGWREWEPETV